MQKEMDDFWDLEKLIPGKKKQPQTALPGVETAFVGEEAPKAPSGERKLHFSSRIREEKQSEEFFYIPQGNPLITKVTVRKRESSYNYYRSFCLQAERYLQEKGEECPYVPFFSYVPQYSHLEPRQKAYYFWWRRCAEEGKYLECDISYLLLYFYEVINLPERIPPQVGAVRMATVWAAYQEKFPKLNRYMSIWLADYCLIHQVSCPGEILRPFLPKILTQPVVKEFYLGASEDLDLCQTEALLELASDYDWRSGRYASGEHAALFYRHIRESAFCVVRRLLQNGTAESVYSRVTKSYTAFCGSLCAQKAKCEIEIEYYPISHTGSMRQILTASVKYAENKLRSRLAIKSRLSVPAFPAEYRELLDRYFDKNLPIIPKAAPQMPPPEYEKLYDAESVGVCLADAARIEAASWENTKLLVPEEEWEESIRSEIEGPVMEKCDASSEGPKGSEEEGKDANLVFLPDAASAGALPTELVQFIEAALEENSAKAWDVISALHLSPEAACAKINEEFYDVLGDIVLELRGREVVVIPDYREEVLEWLSNAKMK